MSSEGRGDPSSASPQASGVKVLETLKRHIFEHADSPSKSLSSREVCSSFSDLTATVFSTSQRANSSVVVSGAIELLVHACSSQDRAIRLAGQENLHKLVKKLQSTHLSRLQQDLFHELKKNGSARSLSVALEVFAALFPQTRPSRRQPLSQSLLPVLLRLLARDEEALHESLQEALALILPTLTPLLSTTNNQLLMSALLERLSDSPASYRRMAASSLHGLASYAKSPQTLTLWLVGQMLTVGCRDSATEQTCQGLLLALQNMTNSHGNFTLDLLKQVYGFVLSCMLYRDGNTAIAAMETMNSLLLSPSPGLSHWLMEAQPSSTVATQFWKLAEDTVDKEGEEGERGVGGQEEQESISDAHSLREEINDNPRSLSLPQEINDAYFDSDQEPSSSATADSPVTSDLFPGLGELGCLAVRQGPNQPLPSLVLYLTEKVLASRRVSAMSLGLACLTSSADISPSLFPSLSPYLPFTFHTDPKLKSCSAKLLAVLLRAVLRGSRGEASQPLVSEAASALRRLLADGSPVVLKAVCESLRICLPSLACSSHPQLAVGLVQPLLAAASSSSYWLAKVELLRTLACLPLTALALSLPSLPHSLLSVCVFPLLGDGDHRVRTAAAEAMALLAPSLKLTSDPVLAHAQWEVLRELPPLQSHAPHLSLGLQSSKTSPPSPLGLKHILWFLVDHVSSSEDHSLQRGCLEALHVLCSVFPPASLPLAWGCACHTPSLLPTALSLLTASHLAWTVQGHQQLLDVCSALFLSVSLSAVDRCVRSGQSPASSAGWAALDDTDLATHALLLLRHVGRLLAVFVHVLEGREPETRETKKVSTVSPRKTVGREASPIRSSPAKPKVQIIENLQKPPLVPRDGLGQFASSQPHLKILDACRSAYTNYQVSLAAVGEDKFSRLLQSTHNLAITLFEVALAADVSKYVEELMSYFTCTFQVDPSGALLCVQQLLNALFGMNVPAQHTSIHSPYLSSLPFQLHSLLKVSSPSPSPHPLIEATLSQPLAIVESWLEEPPPNPHHSPSLPRKRTWLPGRKALAVKPGNPVSSVKDYIAHFEPLVVSVVKRFPHMSSLLLQQRTLFLLVQLIQLKVRYELLDCNHTFLESVLKLVGLMESGVVRDGEDLVPFLFQFLVLLAYDNSQLVTIPEVMQRCDGVMASGHSVDTFAIPALQPLVLNLFVRPGREDSELETQREVVLSMLIRVIDHSRVLPLLTHVLDCFSRSTEHWLRVSGQILASLLNAVGRLSLVLDTADSMATLYHLFSAMDPSALSVKALFVSLLKQQTLSGAKQLCRWLAVLNTTLTLMRSLFPESTLYSELNSVSLGVPGVKSEEVEVEGEPPHLPESDPPPTKLAWFLLGVLRVTAETEEQLELRPGPHPQPLLPQLLGRCLLLLSSLVSGEYESLRLALSSLTPPPSLSSAFLSLLPSYPMLTLHYCHLSLLTDGRSWVLSVLHKCSGSMAPSHCLLYHCLLPLLTGSGCSVLANALVNLCDCDGTSKEEALLQKLLNSDLSTPMACMQALQVARGVGSVTALPLLCRRLVTHPLSCISSPAASLSRSIVANDKISSCLARELLSVLSATGNRYPELLRELQQLADLPSVSSQGLPSSPSHPLESTLSVQAVTKLWYLAEVYELCLTSSDPWLCGRVLARLSFSELSELLQNSDFPKALLEVCVSHGLELSLSSPAVSSSTAVAPHPLLQASHDNLLSRILQDPSDSSLLPAILWLLLAQEMLALPPIDGTAVSAVLTVIASGLKETDTTLALQTALDCFSLTLALPEVQSGMDDAWLATTVSLVSGLVGSSGTCEEDGSLSQQLHSALSHCLTHGLHPPLKLHIETAILSLARLPSLHASCLIPPLLLSPDSQSPSEQVLDQALLEGEVLQQFMARSNCTGWLGRSQFEERWMQLLGVVNQPPPAEGMPVEEVYAHTLNMCVGLVGVVSLLLATNLRPQPGNPVFAVPMHTHRNRDILFLGTKPGRCLSVVRWVVERQLLLQCGARSNLYSHYQCPLLSHLSLPLFTRNVERGPGETELGPAQLSLRSLWPVTLANPTSPARQSPDGVDVRSCVLSLVDLFSHWLSQPLHSLLLLHTLRAVLMLSDLFSLPSQFEWLVRLACDLSDQQPSEDTAVHSVLMHCMLKAAAVVKVDGLQLERIARNTERALSSETLEVQEGCLYGLLYVAEDPGSQLAALLSPSLAKYLIPQLEAFHRHTERHCHLCWSLAVTLALHHSHLLKSTDFAGQLLEKAIPPLLHPHTSTALFHSLCLGLELLVVNFALSNEQRSKVTHVTANRCAKCELDKSLPALGLLVSCMYSGEQGSYVLSDDAESEAATETSIQMREHVGILVEHLRHGPLEGVRFLVDLVPVLMVDFLPPVQVLQMVVTEFVSPHQPRPSLAALIMGEAFSLLLGKNMGDMVSDWVLLSLDSFVQQEPESKAVWCLVCLLTAASSSSVLQALLEVVADQPDMPLTHLETLLVTAASHFCTTQVTVMQQKLLVEKFLSSSYKTLNTVAYACLHSV